MEELNEYGAFNTSYEGVGRLWYVGKPDIPVYFDVRHLADGQLIVGCVSAGAPIEPNPSSIGGHLLSGEPFDTVHGRGIKESYRTAGTVHKAHYLATMTRVRYTKELQPNNHSIEFALHNFIPGSASASPANEIKLNIRGHPFAIYPARNHSQQVDRLRRYGGNLRTAWVQTKFENESKYGRFSWSDLDEAIFGLLNAVSLATGTLVTSPQRITFDPNRDRNDVEHYSSEAKTFSTFIRSHGWDTPIVSTIDAWFSGTWPVSIFGPSHVSVWIRQHLDACAIELYLETRALSAATLLDVMAGRYCPVWTSRLPKDVSFKDKLTRLLLATGIVLPAAQMDVIIKARNSLVHAGRFVTTEGDTEYKNFVRLGRSVLLRLIGFPSTLHETIEI
jgi:hypothetical protein